MDQHIIEGNRPRARATPIGKTAVVVGAGIAGHGRARQCEAGARPRPVALHDIAPCSQTPVGRWPSRPAESGIVLEQTIFSRPFRRK
jgi:hypothetical protein